MGVFWLTVYNIAAQGHENFISQLDWSRDGRFLQSVSGDYDLLYCKLSLQSPIFTLIMYTSFNQWHGWVFHPVCGRPWYGLCEADGSTKTKDHLRKSPNNYKFSVLFFWGMGALIVVDVRIARRPLRQLDTKNDLLPVNVVLSWKMRVWTNLMDPSSVRTTTRTSLVRSWKTPSIATQDTDNIDEAGTWAN